MNYLMLMTFAGSTLFLGYLCWAGVCDPFLTQRMKYWALVMVLLVYAIPWLWLKAAYSSLFGLFVKGEFTTNGEMSVSFADITAEGGAYRTQGYWLQLSFLGIWFLGVLIFLVKKLVSYTHDRKYLLKVVNNLQNSLPEQIAERFQKEFRYKRKPEIVEMPGRNKTFTIGAIKPVIFLQKEYAAGELEFIIKHEMVHIARRDLLIKLLLELVCCLHWFNPLVYVLKRHFGLLCETSCDERVISGCSDEERKAYARLLVDNMDDGSSEISLSSALECEYKRTEERVNLIMKNKVVKGWKKKVAGGVFAMALALNSLTALAYPDVYHVEDATSKVAESVANGNSFWVCDREEGHNVPTNVILYPEQFVDETGEIYPAVSTQGLLCTIFGHDIVSGYLQTHDDNGDGSCTVNSYESTRCTRCNTIWVGDLSSSNIYNPCPHDL